MMTENDKKMTSDSLWDQNVPPNDDCGDAVCRVCHGESEELRPLFHPCRCDGSIKFVHNDCLLEWLRISKKTDPKCELCGEKFKFRRVYAEDTPTQLSVFEFMGGLVPRIEEVVTSFVRGLIVMLLWVILLPFFSSWWMDQCCSFLLTGSFSLNFMLFQTPSTDLKILWWNGAVIFIGIVLATGGLLSLCLYIDEEMGRSLGEGVDRRESEEGQMEGAADPSVGEALDGDNQPEATAGVGSQPLNVTGEAPSDSVTTATAEEVANSTQQAHVDMTAFPGNSATLDATLNPAERSCVPDEHDATGTDDAATIGHAFSVDAREGVDGTADGTLASSDAVVEEAREEEEEEEEEEEDNALLVHPPDGAPPVQLRAAAEPPLPVDRDRGIPVLAHLVNPHANDDLLDIIGYTGPLATLLNHVALCCVHVTLFTAVAVVLPVLLGRWALHLLKFQAWGAPRIYGGIKSFLLSVGATAVNSSNSTGGHLGDGFAGSIITHESLRQRLGEGENLSALFHRLSSTPVPPEFVALRMLMMVEGVCGYVILLSTLLLCVAGCAALRTDRTIQANFYARIKARLQICAQEFLKWFKVSSYLAIEITAVPHALGWIIDIVTLNVFGVHIEDRMMFFQERPMICSLIHLLVGFFFAIHVALVMSEARRILKPNVLTRFLPEYQFFADDNSLEALGVQSAGFLAERLLLNLCYYIPSILLMVMIPTKIGHVFVPTAQPFKLFFETYSQDVQLPLELIVFHFLFPLLIRKYNHREFMRLALHRYLIWACDVLELRDDILDPEVVDEALRPHELFGEAGAVPRGGERNDDGGGNAPRLPLVVVIGEEALVGAVEDRDASVHEEVPIHDEVSEGLESPDFNNVGGSDVDDATEIVVNRCSNDSAPADQSVDGDSIESVTVECPLELTGEVTGEEGAAEVEFLPVGVENLGHTMPATRGGARSDGRTSCNKTIRYIGLTIMTTIAVVVLFSWIVHIPFILGRYLLRITGVFLDNDLYALAVGLTSMMGCHLVVQCIAREFARSYELSVFAARVGTWSVIFLKNFVLLAIWFTVIPLLLGLLLEAAVVAPFRTPLDESPSYHFIQSWAMGLLFLKIWLRCTLVGALGENAWKLRFDRVMQRGFEGVQFVWIMQEILIPIIVTLLDLIFFPYFASRALCLVGSQSYKNSTLTMRFSFLIYFAVRIAWMGLVKFKTVIVKVHNEIRDSRYLLGTELKNR